MPRTRTLRLNPETVVLHRRNGDIQFGWDPESAMVVHVGSSADRRAVLDLIRLLDGTLAAAVVFRRASEGGLTPERAARIVADLIESGHVIDDRPRPPRSVRVHGDGPLADAITDRLSTTSISVTRSRSVRTLSDVQRWKFDLIVLADSLVWDPAFIHELLRTGLPHLQIRVRDGKGIVGPLVVPGITSCLLCADLTRSEYEPEWPILASQLLGKTGLGMPETISVATSFAVAAIRHEIGLNRPESAGCRNTTVEVCTNQLDIARRHWQIHPDCACQNLHNHPRRHANTVS